MSDKKNQYNGIHFDLSKIYKSFPLSYDCSSILAENCTFSGDSSWMTLKSCCHSLCDISMLNWFDRILFIYFVHVLFSILPFSVSQIYLKHEVKGFVFLLKISLKKKKFFFVFWIKLKCVFISVMPIHSNSFVTFVSFHLSHFSLVPNRIKTLCFLVWILFFMLFFVFFFHFFVFKELFQSWVE